MRDHHALKDNRPPSIVLVASRSFTLRKTWSQSLPTNSIAHLVRDGLTLKLGMETLRPSVALVDSALLGPRKNKTLTKLRQLSSDTKMIIFADQPNDKEGIATLKAGAKGYCSNRVKASLLRRAVEKVESGEVWIGRRLMVCLIDELYRLSRPVSRYDYSELQKDSPCPLTLRQREVARLISSGARNKEISNRLGVSEKTVKAHLTVIFSKLGVSDRLSLAVYLREQHLLANQPAPSDS